MLQVNYLNPKDPRQPHCLIDETRIDKITPIFGERVPGRKDDDEIMFSVCSPSTPRRRSFRLSSRVRWRDIRCETENN